MPQYDPQFLELADVYRRLDDMRESRDRQALIIERLLAVARALLAGHRPEVDRLLELEPESEAWLEQLAKIEALCN